MRNFVFGILVLLISISGCNLSINNSTINSNIYEDNVKIDAYFCPRDNCEKIIIDEINSAQDSLYCAFYELKLKDVISAIGKKSHAAGVKIVIDEGNYESQIKGQGVKTANSLQYMHNKFCIIDNKKVLTGSTNPTDNGVNFNNNNLIIIESKFLSENYKDEFDELWNGIYTAGDEVRYNKINSNNLIIENYFCPEDNCKEQVIKTLDQAQESIYFMTFSFTDEEIADAILFKKINIKGIFENRGSGTDYSQYTRLKDFGIEVKKDKNKKTMHHKVFIIDNKTVITGSMNPTGSGNFRNDENLLIIHNEEIAKEFLEEFELLWA